MHASFHASNRVIEKLFFCRKSFHLGAFRAPKNIPFPLSLRLFGTCMAPFYRLCNYFIKVFYYKGFYGSLVESRE